MKANERRSTSAFCLLLSDFKEMKVNQKGTISAFCLLLSAFK
ncbi:MAG: hypothetical protein WC538_22865 [Thermoanaerobaculia bacterium]|jgi:hypothetical protein